MSEVIKPTKCPRGYGPAERVPANGEPVYLWMGKEGYMAGGTDVKWRRTIVRPAREYWRQVRQRNRFAIGEVSWEYPKGTQNKWGHRLGAITVIRPREKYIEAEDKFEVVGLKGPNPYVCIRKGGKKK